MGAGTAVPNFMFIGAEVWQYSPQTVKIWHLVHKFAPQGDLFAQFL